MKGRVLERTLLGVGILLLAVWGGAAVRSHVLQAWDRFTFDQALLGRQASVAGFLLHVLPGRPEEPRSAPMVALKAPPPDQREWSPARIRAWNESRPATQAIGKLQIPSLALDVMVLDGTDEWTLNRGVGRIEGTSLPGGPGNLGIAGHRDGFFRGLRKISIDDRIVLTTLGGTYEYRVRDIDIVPPADVSVLESSSASELTLVTCYPFYYVGDAPLRYIVRASLVRKPSPGLTVAESTRRGASGPR